MTLATLEIAWLASICNHGGGLSLLGLYEVVYAGRPAGRPGLLGTLPRSIKSSAAGSAGYRNLEAHTY